MWTDSRALDRLTTQVSAMQRQLDLVMAHLGIEPVEPVHTEVAGHIMAGRKISAVKVYREQTGVGLAEAKREVEAMAVKMGVRI